MELAEKLCSEEKNRRSQVPQVLHLKRIRKDADEDLSINKKTKCKICQLIKKKGEMLQLFNFCEWNLFSACVQKLFWNVIEQLNILSLRVNWSCGNSPFSIPKRKFWK